MVDPKDIITFPKGQFITTTTAAKTLDVHIRRVRQFIESGALKAIKIEEGGAFYISLKDFEAFEKKPRSPGRPSAKKAAKK
jgi:excisionase family DNA binding protein